MTLFENLFLILRYYQKTDSTFPKLIGQVKLAFNAAI